MNVVQHFLALLVRTYQVVLSPAKTVLFGPLGRCRFEPSCSHYALEAIRSHGALRGSWLTFRRLLRCHPWGGCGSDPVPPLDNTGGCARLHGRRSDAMPATGR